MYPPRHTPGMASGPIYGSRGRAAAMFHSRSAISTRHWRVHFWPVSGSVFACCALRVPWRSRLSRGLIAQEQAVNSLSLATVGQALFPQPRFWRPGRWLRLLDRQPDKRPPRRQGQYAMQPPPGRSADRLRLGRACGRCGPLRTGGALGGHAALRLEASRWRRDICSGQLRGYR